MSARLILEIAADTSRAVAGLRSMGGAADTAEKKTTGGFGRVAKAAGAVAGAAALGGVVAVLKTGVNEQMDYLSGQAQLAAGLKSTGNAANTSVKEMEALAGSIQGYSGQTDDSIVASEKLLLTFTNIHNATGKNNDIFNQATKATADMAAKMGGDASKYAVQLGKALNDPVKGISALTRVGVSFTEGQKKQIKALQESGDTMGAQKIIMGELNKEFGGAAKAAGQTAPGQLARARRSFEDLAQTVGAAVVPMLVQLAQSVLPILQQAFRIIGPVVNQLVRVLGPVLSVVLKALMPIISQLASILGSVLVQAVRILGPLLQQLAPLFVAIVKIAGALLMPVLKALAPIFAPLIQAVMILMGALKPLVPPLTQLATILGQAVAQALIAVAPLLVTMANLLAAEIKMIRPLLPLVNMLARLIGVILTAALRVVVPALNFVMRGITAWYLTMARMVQRAVSAVSSGVRSMSTWFGRVAGYIGRALSGVTSAITRPFSSAWNWISSMARRIGGLFSGVASAVGRALSGVTSAITAPFQAAWNFIRNNVISPIRTGWNAVANVINSVHFSYTVPSNAITKFLHIAGHGFSFGGFHIPTLASGGVVDRATLAMIGEGNAREVVAPEPMLRQLIRDELGNASINITINGALDPVAVGRQVRDVLRKQERRSHGVQLVGAPVGGV